MAVFWDPVTREQWPVCNNLRCMLDVYHTPFRPCDEIARGWYNPSRLPVSQDEREAREAEQERDARK